MQKKLFDRILSMLLVLVMVISTVPAAVFATEEAAQEETASVDMTQQAEDLITVDETPTETTVPVEPPEIIPPAAPEPPQVEELAPAPKPPATKAGTVATSGTTGDCKWSLDGTRLTISGNGPMANYSNSYDLPWSGNVITEVIIDDGVTTIGHYAFYWFSSISSVTIGNSVQTIGHHAFSSCSGLTSVTIGDSVKTIGAYAFDSCESLTSVTLGDNLTTVYERGFSFCDNLTTVDLGDSITSIPDSFFYKCPKLETVTFGDNVTSIGASAFSYCSSLQYIEIGDSITSIGENAFYECTGLKTVVGGKNITAVGEAAYGFCDNLTEVSFGESFSAVPNFMFYYCNNLKTVTLGDSVVSIGNSAFEGCRALMTVEVPDSVTTVGNYAFYRCSALTSITLGDNVTSLGISAFGDCTSLKSAKLGKNIVHINAQTFYMCSSLQTVTLGEYVSTIGEKAFYECNALSAIDLPNTVSSMGETAFYRCDSLTSVIIPYSMKTIPEFVFTDCHALKTVVIPESVTSIGYYSFGGYTSLETVYYGGSRAQWDALKVNSIQGIEEDTHLIYLADFTVFYKTNTDHIFPISYEKDLPVEPLSSFNGANLSIPGLTVQLVSGPASVAKDKMTVEVSPGSSGTVTLATYYRNKKVMTSTYTVASTGGDLFAAGFGTEQRPYLIQNASEFANLGKKTQRCYYQLIDNIPLGSITPVSNFYGVLEGCGYTLSGWTAKQTIGNGDLGLFKVVQKDARISNLEVQNFSITQNNPDVSGTLSVGLLCGTNYGTISDIKVTQSSMNVDVGDIGKGADSAINAGMLCGDNYGTIVRCEVYGSSSVKNSINAVASADKSHTAQIFAGGLVGYSYGGSIQDCQTYYTNINARATTKGTTFISLWCTGHGTSKVRIGGVVGHLYGTALTRVLGYSNNNLSGTSNHDGCGCSGEGYAGSIVGYSDNISLTDVFAQNNTSLNLVGNSTNYNGNKVAFGGYSNLLKLATYIDNGWVAVGNGDFSIAQTDYISASLADAQFEQGRPIDLNGLTVTACMEKASDGLSAEIRGNTAYSQKVPITRGYTISGYNPDKLDYQEVMVSYGAHSEKIIVLVSAHDHTWITEATCARGQECGTCGYISADTPDHRYEATVTAPTCEGGGYTTHTCRDCGHTYEDAALPALGHTLDFLGKCVNCGEQLETLRDFTVYVCDAESGKPIAGASVTMGGIKILTESNGAAKYQLSNEDARKLVIEANGYPKYDNKEFIPSQMPEVYIYLESESTGIYEAWCNGDNVLIVDSQVNCRAPLKEAKIVVKGRAQSNILKYEIVQDGKVLETSTNGIFKIKNPYFQLNAPVFVRMHTDGRDGHDMFERELKISVVGVSIDVKLDELFPFIGESGFTFDESAPSLFSGVGIEFPDLNKNDKSFALEISNERIVLTYGLEKDYLDKDNDDKTSKELFKEILKKFDQQNDPNFWPKGKKKSELTATAALIVEFNADGVTAVYGEIHIGYEFSYNWGKTFVVWVVPIYAGVDFKVGGEWTISDIGYDFENSKWKIPDNEFRLYVELTAKGGIGCSLISAGVYGTAGGELILGMADYTDYVKYRFYGELGLYLRVDPIFWEAIEYKLPLISGEWYGPNGQVKLKREMLVSDNYEVAHRDYLENRSAWNAIPKRGDTSGVMQTSSYTAIEPRIVQSGDTVMMLFLDDDGSQGYNYQHLYYSILDPKTNSWKTPVRVDDSQFADIDYDVYADDSGIYIAYTKIPEITEDNYTDHMALLSGVEVYTAQWGGTGFGNNTNVSNNNCYDAQPQVTGDAVVWVSNKTNDTLGENANNTLMLARKSDNWTAVTLNQNGSTVTSMDMGVLDGKTFVALVRDIDCDLTTDDRSLQLIDLSGVVTDVPAADYTSEGIRFETVDGKGVLQWACAGNVWQLNAADGTPVALFAEANYAINESFRYQQLGEGRAVILFAQNAMNGTAAGSSLYGVYCVDGQWGQPVEITKHAEGMYVDAFDACYYKDQILLAYINTEATIGEQTIHRTCNFVSSSIELKNDLIAEDVSLMDSELFDGSEIELRIPVTNGSWQKLKNTKVQLQTQTGAVAYEQDVALEEELTSGESGIVVLKLPKTCLTSGQKYSLLVTSTDWTDSDLSNNAVPLDLWYADFEVVANQILQGEDSCIQYAVVNKGNYTGHGTVKIYGGKNIDGTFNGQPELYSQNITVEIGKNVTAMVPVTDAFKNETVYVVIEPTTPEKYDFNNQQSVSIRAMERTTTKDITGTEQAIPNPVFAEPYVIYDRYAGGDIAATATENDWTFTTIDGLDSFTYSNSVLTIPESYLKNAELGYHYYTLRYTMGDKTAEALLIVEIRDHAPLSVENVTVEYDGAPVTLSELSYETPSTGAVSTRYSTGDGWVDGLPTNAGKYTVELSLAAEENGFYTAAKQEFVLTVTKAVRSLSAPTNVKKTDKGIAFTGATPDKEPADGTITYGYSEKCDPTSVKQWSATGLIAPDSTYKTYYLYARITDSSNYMDTYSAAYMLDVESLEPVAAVYINGKEKAKYTDFGKAVEACGTNGYIKLVRDAKISITLTKDLYVDLNGYDLTGTIIGGKVYGMDSTTDKYTCDNRGVFSCTDARGADVVPQTHFKSSVTGAVKRYMAISEGNGYSFHRFYLGVTHMSIKPSVTSVGFKAAFYGDEMVVNMLNENQAYGYSLGLSGYGSASAYKSRDSFESGRTVTMRIDNYDVEHFGETVLSAHVMLKLCDGTVIESADVTMTLRQLLEKLNANPSQMTADQLKVVARMIEKYPVIKSWNVSNLIQ